MMDEQGNEIEVGVEVGNVEHLPMTGGERESFDIQIATAKQFPRSITKSLQEAKELATLDTTTAGSMFYTLPKRDQDGNFIEGPSARLAEIMAYSWGNLRADARIVDEGKTHVTAVGTCMDLEKNVAIRVEVKRRITTKTGKRYGDDMIGVTSNAAISIALRNAVFKTIPAAFARRIYEAARKTSIGEAGSMAKKRADALEFFGKAGVTPEQVYKVLNVNGPDDIGVEQLITLKGLANAIKEGEISVESIFNPPKDTEGARSLDEALAAATEPKADAKTEPDPLVEEAYVKALKKAEKLAKAEKLELGDSEKLDELRDAGDLDGLIAMDADFKARLKEATP